MVVAWQRCQTVQKKHLEQGLELELVCRAAYQIGRRTWAVFGGGQKLIVIWNIQWPCTQKCARN